MSYSIAKNQTGVELLTYKGKWIEGLNKFLNNIKSSNDGRVQKKIIDVYNDSNDKLKKLIEDKILKNVDKIKIYNKTYNTNDNLKKTFKINDNQLNTLIINSSLRKPIYLNNQGIINKINITDKPLATREFTDKIKNVNDIVKLFSGKITKIDNINVAFDIRNIKTSYNITFNFDVKFSDTFENRTKTDIVNDTFNNLSDINYVNSTYFENIKQDYIKSGSIQFSNISYSINAIYNDKNLNIDNMVMRKKNPLKIDNLFNNVIDVKNGNCILKYLSSIWKKLSKNTIEKFKTPNDLLEFCKSKNIKTICYDIFGNVINSFYPKKNNKTYKSLIYICYDNHIYPLKNTYLEKRKIDNYEIKITNLINNRITYFLSKDIIPANIKLDKDNNIISFTNENIKYINNNEYLICKQILNKFGLDDKIYDTIKVSNLGGIIEKLYLKSNVNSFMPFEYTKQPFIYRNNNINFNNDEIITIDKNKCYSNALYNLDFIIKCDIKYNNYYNHILLDSELKFIDNYLYLVEPENSTILLPNQDLYSGLFLNYCKNEGLKFIVYQTLETNKESNYYKSMIQDLYNKLDYNIKINDQEINCAKYIINIMIGKFNQPIKKQIYKSNINIVDKTNLDYYNGYTFNLNNDYNIIYDTYEDIKYIYNKIPVDIQIKDESRKILYEKMKELNIKNDDIIQIKTDSITFKGKHKNINNINKLFLGWKYEKCNLINTNENIIIKHFDLDNIKSYLNTTLYDCYAGAGKSHHIIKTYKNNKDYIILTPKHNANKDYKKNNFNCDVIQTYEYSDKIPVENIIIVDEIGQVSYKGWEIIIRCAMLGKIIKLYGDFKQLEPIDGNIYNSNLWINYFYRDVKKINTNFRNNFNIEYYDKLINGEIKKEEILKYNNSNSDNIIVYRNITKDDYNLRICKKKGIKNIFDVGNKIICKTNDLRDKKIFNGFTYIIKEKHNDYVITEDNIKIMIKDLLSNFDYGWALTIHKLQGETLKDYFFAKEDIHFCNNPKLVYTIISRLKQDLTEETKARNNNLISCWD